MTASILTHNGEITLKNPATNKHRTFRIKTVRKGKYKGQRKLYMLIGPDNNSNYLCLGFIKNNGTFHFWNDYKGTLYERTANCLLEIEKRGLIASFATKCRVCNKKLTTPESIETGIGPICGGRE